MKVRLAGVPEEVDAGGTLPVSFTVTTRSAGLLACEASLWTVLEHADGRDQAEVVKVVLPPAMVEAGTHEQTAELVVPGDARPSVRTPVGEVRYEVNAVAVFAERSAVANRKLTVRSTAPDTWIEPADDGTADWGLSIEAPPARPGEVVLGVVRFDPRGHRGPVDVLVELERYEERTGHEPRVRWHREVGPVTLDHHEAINFEFVVPLPADAVPTVMTAAFAERWQLTATARADGLVRQAINGVAVLS